MKSLVSVLIFNFFVVLNVLVAQDAEVGLASFYSDKFHGKPTASGDLYDKNEMTTAHKTHEFGTVLKVTNIKDGRSVRVRVTDRGPFISGRVVDLSRAAAAKIGLTEKEGLIEVKVEKAGSAAPAEQPIVRKPAPKPAPVVPAVKPTPKPAPAEKEVAQIAAAEAPQKAVKAPKVEKAKVKTPTIKTTPKNTVTAATESASSRMKLARGADFDMYDLFSIELKKPEKKGYAVQVGVYTSIESTFSQIADLQGKWFNNILLNIEKGSDGIPVYKLLLGQFETQEQAQAYKESLKKKKIEGFVVGLAGEE